MVRILFSLFGALLLIGCRENKGSVGSGRAEPTVTTGALSAVELGSERGEALTEDGEVVVDAEADPDTPGASGQESLQEGSPDDDEKVLHYLREVLLNKEFGDGDGSIVRWVEPPDVVLAEGDEKSRAVFDRVIQQLNDALEGTSMRLQSVVESRRERRIDVFMVPGSRFSAIGRARGFKVHGKQDGYVWVFWDTRKQFIQRAIVLVAVDRIAGDLLEHVLLEELTQSLGPLGDTTVLRESVMFQRGNDHGKAPKLSDWDRRMLDLLYGHLNPGNGEAELREAYRRFWEPGP